MKKIPQPKPLPELRISSSFIPSLCVILTVATVATVADLAGESELSDVFVCLTETYGIVVKGLVPPTIGLDVLVLVG